LNVQQTISHPLTLFVLSLVVMSFGAWLGVSTVRRSGPLSEAVREDFGVVRSAALTLLALVIGFSLSMAVGRYDQRKNYEEEEANAIGTEYLRADLLPAAQAANARALLRQYLDQRIRFYQVGHGDELEQINAATGKLQAQLWDAARSGASAQPNPVSALAVAGMNDVINTQGYTQAAWWNRIPKSAWALMFVVGFFCNVLVGYGTLSDRPSRVFLLTMPLIVSISFTLIADIDSPRNGIIRVTPQNLLSTAASLSKP
jgi:hypothetical protein